MYIPEYSANHNQSEIINFIKKYNFATLVSEQKEFPYISHVPLLYEDGKLLGHVAKANPHAKIMEEVQNIVAIFQGPHGYISPSWYKNPLNVPTWNYSAVHIKGKVKTIHSFDQVKKVINDMVTFEEQRLSDLTGREKWGYNLPEDFKNKLLNAIVVFEINIEKIEAKFKLSQNRSDEDRNSAMAAIENIFGKKSELLNMMTQIKKAP